MELNKVASLFEGLTDVMTFFRDVFYVFPEPIQVLITFGVGSILLLLIINMFFFK